MRSDTRPLSVGTVTSPPSMASCIATGRSTRRSSPSRVKKGCGFTRTRRYASPGGPPPTPGLPWPARRMRWPSFTPGGIFTVSRLAGWPFSREIWITCSDPLYASGRVISTAPLRELLPLGTDRVVPLSLLGIAEDFVSLVDLFEALLRVRLLVDVRVVLACELSVGLLDVLGRGAFRNAKRLVVVLVFDRHPFRPRKLVRRRARRCDARTCRLDLRGRHVRSGQQRRLEHLVDRLHELDVDRVDDLLRDVDQILLVLLRHEEGLDPGAVRR